MGGFPNLEGPGIVVPGQSSEPRRISSPDEMKSLKPGEAFIAAQDPSNEVRHAPYIIHSPDQLRSVPEGMPFIAAQDPTRQVRTKPETDPLDFKAQMLYSLAPDDYRRRKVLEYYYGADAVKTLPTGETMVRQGDRWLNPEKWRPGKLAGDILPTVGAVGGSLGGAALTSPSGPGAIAGGLAGAAAGGGVGQGLNDAILAIFGIHPESAPAEIGGVGTAAALSAAGEGAGRVVGRVVPPVYRAGKAVFNALTNQPGATLKTALPGAIRYAWGTDPAALAQAQKLVHGNPDVGIPPVRTAPSTIHHDAPYIKMLVETFDPKFRESPLTVNRKAYYESQGKDLLTHMGVDRPEGESLLEPKLGLPRQELGSHLQDKLAGVMEDRSSKLQQAIEEHKQAAVAHGQMALRQQQQGVANLQHAADQFREAASRVVEAGFADIDRATDAAVKAASVGAHPADLWEAAGATINRHEAAFHAAAERQYEAAYQAAGPTPMNTAPLVQAAKDLLDTVPAGFDDQLPGVLPKLRDISKPRPTGMLDDEGKEILAVPDVTLEQVHRLRNLLRAKIDWTKPGADAVDHTRKEAESLLNDWMHGPQPPSVQTGVGIMDKTDAYYRKIAPRFDQAAIRTIIGGLKSGYQQDAPVLAKLLFAPNQTLARENAKKLLGPKLWQAVHAADVRDVIASSHIMDTDQISAKALADLVQGRFSSGAWDDSDFGTAVSKLVRQFQDYSAKPGSIPVNAGPDDTVASLLQKANTYLADMNRVSKLDPMGTLKKELAGFEKQKNAIPKQVQQESGQLGSALGIDLTKPQPTVGAIQAAENLLNSEDLIFAASQTFGLNSPEFQFLRDVKVQQMLEHGRADQIFKMDPAVRPLLFPGDSLAKVVELADTMKFLMGDGGDFGASLAATARVTNPIPELRHLGAHNIATMLGHVPIVGNAIGRVLIASYYKAASDFVTGPWFLDFLMKGVPENPVERSAVKKAFDQMTTPARKAARRAEARRGGHVGAGAGALLANQPAYRHHAPPPVRRPPPRESDAALRIMP